jgi:N-acetylneuraminate synthase
MIREINKNMLKQEPFFTAEISGNHNGSLERAIQLIKAAKLAGASAVKFQTFLPEKMSLDLDLPDFKVSPNHPLWGGKKLTELYNQTVTPREWHGRLFETAKNENLIAFSTPFDLDSVDFLEDLNCPMYKIASLETSDLALIKKVASTSKPIIISTGATYMDEIHDAVETCRDVGNSNVTLLVCTSSYPADPADAHVRRLLKLKELFNVRVGISDHTLGIGTSIAAIALGATFIEKHFTDSRLAGGLDAEFSMESNEFANLVREGIAAFKSLGDSEWKMSESENESRRLRRSLYITSNVKKGEKLTLDNISAIRPGFGISPKHLETVLGKKFNEDFTIGTALSFEKIED